MYIFTDFTPGMTTELDNRPTTTGEVDMTTMGENTDATVTKVLFHKTSEYLSKSAPINVGSTATKVLVETTTATLKESTTTETPFVQPTSGPIDCTCSLGFQLLSGGHHLLEDLPNIIPQKPYPINVDSGKDACSTGETKCDAFCTLGRNKIQF